MKRESPGHRFRGPGPKIGLLEKKGRMACAPIVSQAAAEALLPQGHLCRRTSDRRFSQDIAQTATLPSAQGLERLPRCVVLYALEARMQIVVKMKVIMSPPGRILKERPLTASERLQPAHPKAEREPLQFGPQSHTAERR